MSFPFPAVSRRPRAVALAATLLAGALATSAVAGSSPAPPQNPATASNGFAMMHGDTASSDTTPVAAPQPGTATVSSLALGAVCPSVLVGSDRYLLATCTVIATRKPTVFLLDPSTGQPLASLAVQAGKSVLGGVYTYLDAQDRVVIVDGHNDLLRISHVRSGSRWSLTATTVAHLGPTIAAHCGSSTCDTVVGLTPDFAGNIWFATTHGIVGIVTGAGKIRTFALPAGETIGNSISSVPGRTAVITDHALYLLRLRDGAPVETFRSSYDRGPARKPGQLTWGSGTTPVFFGPNGGRDYLAIVDNARPHEHLIVWKLPATPAAAVSKVCTVPVLTRSPQSGTEDAPIGYGHSVVVSSTYGYSYPAGATGTSQPQTATFAGGMTRVDVNASGRGCRTVWDNTVRSAALPRLALQDGAIDTVLSEPAYSSEKNVYADTYYYATVDFATGAVRGRQRLGTGPTFDALQLVGVTTRDHVFYQGTLTGYLRIK